MTELNEEWMQFQNDITYLNKKVSNNKNNIIEKLEMPKCSDIYISTQTKIAYLNQEIDLNDIFWKLPVIPYHQPINGIIKKSIKINCHTPEDVEKMENQIKEETNIQVTILSKIDNPNARKKKFKDIRKIDIGICKKDITSHRKKKKGAFYNCFAVILRIFYKNEFKEVHVKIFNTGKLEIPGIQYDELLTITLKNLLYVLSPLTSIHIDYKRNEVQTVLINSNFSCGFFIDRFKLYKILKFKYNIHASYDPCSYPGIQCKFCYNPGNDIHDGIWKENPNLTTPWSKVSFMIFRTGSVLIVGNCNSNVLHIIYRFLKKVLAQEYTNISIKNNTVIKKKTKKKIRKKVVLFTIE